jgi:hypothetical protein
MADTFDRFTGAKSTYAAKRPCRVATTANVALTGFQTIDGVTFASTDEDNGLSMRCLVKDQTNAYDNGIYRVNSGDWTREKDFDGNTDFCRGTFVFIATGTANAGKVFYVSSDDPHEIGVSSISFSIFDIDSFISGVETVASGATVDLNSTELIVDISGSSAITAISLNEGRIRFVRFSGAATLTHSASLILPGSQSIVTASGDTAIFTGYSASTVRCLTYQRATSYPLTTGAATLASASTVDLGSVREKFITISGNVTVSSFGSSAPTGTVKHITFSGSSLTLTHNASAIVIPSNLNLSISSGDCISVSHSGSGVWIVSSVTRKYGRCMLSSNYTQSSTTGSTQSKSLMEYDVPENAMTSNGFIIRVNAYGSCAGTTTDKRITLNFGSAVIADTGTLALNGLTWKITSDIIRTSTSSQLSVSTRLGSSTSLPMFPSIVGTTEDVSSTINISIDAVASTTVSTSITARAMTVELIPNTVS